MDSMYSTLAAGATAPCRTSPGNLVWDAGFEAWKCDLHRYAAVEIRLDRCAREDDRLRVEAVRATEDRFSVAYTLSPPDSERPKCLALVSADFAYWGQAVDCAGDLASAFVRGSHENPLHAVLGHWNAFHIISDQMELQAWRWDGVSVFDLKRQTILLDRFPESLLHYASNIPRELVIEQELRIPDEAMLGRYLMDVVAVDRQGFALIQTTWHGTSGVVCTPNYIVSPVAAAKDLVCQYRRGWCRAHALFASSSDTRRAS